MTFISVNSNEVAEALRIEKQRDKARLERRDEQIRQLFDSLSKQDLAALQAIQAEKIRADRTEEKLTIANEKLKSVVFRHSRNDRERDSILRATLHP